MTTPVLTIDTRMLRGLFLPLYREHADSLDFMVRLAQKALGKKSNEYDLVHTARMAVRKEVEKLADEITLRGGLLLIGGAA